MTKEYQAGRVSCCSFREWKGLVCLRVLKQLRRRRSSSFEKRETHDRFFRNHEEGTLVQTVDLSLQTCDTTDWWKFGGDGSC